jgi:hypothetical protein
MLTGGTEISPSHNRRANELQCNSHEPGGSKAQTLSPRCPPVLAARSTSHPLTRAPSFSGPSPYQECPSPSPPTHTACMVPHLRACLMESSVGWAEQPTPACSTSRAHSGCAWTLHRQQEHMTQGTQTQHHHTTPLVETPGKVSQTGRSKPRGCCIARPHLVKRQRHNHLRHAADKSLPRGATAPVMHHHGAPSEEWVVTHKAVEAQNAGVRGLPCTPRTKQGNAP